MVKPDLSKISTDQLLALLETGEIQLSEIPLKNRTNVESRLEAIRREEAKAAARKEAKTKEKGK